MADEQHPREPDPQEQLKAIEDDPPSDPRPIPGGPTDVGAPGIPGEKTPGHGGDAER